MRTQKLTLVLTEKEKEQVKAAADGYGLSIAEYVRLVLRGVIQPTPKPKE